MPTSIDQPTATRLRVLLGVAVVLIVSSCSPTNETLGTPAPGRCTRDYSASCAVVGVVFADPLPLANALDIAARADGITLAVIRSDYVCITDDMMGPFEIRRTPSWFALVDPDELRSRRTSIAEGLAPPITGALIFNTFYNMRRQEWSEAQHPAATFDGAVLYVPGVTASQIVEREAVSWVGDVPWRLTDSYDPSQYPGEIMIDGDAMDEIAAVPRRIEPHCRSESG